MSIDPARHCDPARMARWRAIDAERAARAEAPRPAAPLDPVAVTRPERVLRGVRSI